MNIKHLRTGFLIFLLFCFSCTPYKNVPYFQDLKTDSVTRQKIENFSPVTIQPGDLLGLHVTSLNREADLQFNYNLVRPTTNADVNINGPEQSAVVGYPVDRSGNITLPLVGKVKVSGYTTSDADSLLSVKLAEVLTKPDVKVRIENFKISVLGDVRTPGTYGITSGNTITLTQALALAGDMNTTGVRTDVLLVREINGNRDYVHFDLTKKDIFISPYYYLKNNDVIYVRPNKEKVNNEGTAFEKATLILTALSILAIIFSKNL